MRRYDTTFIINPQIGDEQIDARIKEVTSIITSNGGSVLKEDRMGSRRLAYDIARQTHGYYVCLVHDSEAGVLETLDRHFKLGGDYLRHLTIQFDGDPNRQNMTEIMMGFESERRERDGGQTGSAKSAAEKPAAAAEASPAVEAPKSPAVEEKTAPVSEPEAEPATETPASAQSEEDTL